jgi:hypothetical protein
MPDKYPTRLRGHPAAGVSWAPASASPRTIWRVATICSFEPCEFAERAAKKIAELTGLPFRSNGWAVR